MISNEIKILYRILQTYLIRILTITFTKDIKLLNLLIIRNDLFSRFLRLILLYNSSLDIER